MKILVAAVCLLAISTVSTREIQEYEYEVSVEEFIASNARFMQRNSKIAANVNDYIDNILLKFSKYVILKGLDPLRVDDIIEGFSVKLGLINFHGDLKLTHGWLQGLSGTYRDGDATLEYEGQILNLRLPLAFNTMNINFDYSASIMNIGPYGGLEGKIHGVSVYIDISIDTVTTEIILQNFEITDAGSVNIRFSGNPLVDWLVNVLNKLATKILHNVVISIVEKKVHGLIENMIDGFNDRSLHSSVYDYSLLYK